MAKQIKNNDRPTNTCTRLLARSRTRTASTEWFFGFIDICTCRRVEKNYYTAMEIMVLKKKTRLYWTELIAKAWYSIFCCCFR